MKLLYPYVAIEADKPEEETKSGILLSQQIKTYPPFGTVRYVAPDIPELKPGDRVIYKVYAGVDIDDDLTIVPIDAVIGVLDEKG